MSKLQDNLQKLQEATDQYIEAETERLNNEASVLQAILDGRTSGRGVQKLVSAAIQAVAYSDLADYLNT